MPPPPPKEKAGSSSSSTKKTKPPKSPEVLEREKQERYQLNLERKRWLRENKPGHKADLAARTKKRWDARRDGMTDEQIKVERQARNDALAAKDRTKKKRQLTPEATQEVNKRFWTDLVTLSLDFTDEEADAYFNDLLDYFHSTPSNTQGGGNAYAPVLPVAASGSGASGAGPSGTQQLQQGGNPSGSNYYVPVTGGFHLNPPGDSYSHQNSHTHGHGHRNGHGY